MPICGINGRRYVARRLRGFSMVELMIALAVGLLLLGGIIQLLISSRASYQVGEQVSRIQESGRYVVNMFAERTRRSLSLGCRNAMMEIPLDGVSVSGDALIVNSCLLQENTTDCTGESVVRTDAALGYDSSEKEGDEASWLKDMPDGATNPVDARWLRGDVLVIWGTEGAGTEVNTFTAVTNAETGESEITSMTLAEKNKELGAGAEAAMITNCEQSHLFDIESSDDDVLTIGAGSGETLSGNYDIPDYNSGVALESMNPLNKALVYPFIYEAYFVCCTDTESGSLVSSSPDNSCDDSDQYRPSLCKWRAGGDTQTLVNEIADMRITYSGDTDDDGVVDFRASDRNTAHTAAWVTEQGHWSKVIGAQIELLVTSDSPVRFGDAEEEAPIDLRWPPNDPDSPPNSPDDAHVDTLGYALRSLTDNRRLFERYVISAAFRARAPWFIKP